MTVKPPSPSVGPLYRAILGTALALTAILAVLVAFGRAPGVIAEIPSFIVMAHGFIMLAAACVAFMALGRYRVLQDRSSYWTGLAFAAYSIFSVFYVLSWPGLHAAGTALIGHNPSAPGWNFLISQLVLGSLLIAAAAAGRPRGDSPRAPSSRWSLALCVAVVAALGALIVGRADILPAWVSGNTFTAVGLWGSRLAGLIMAVGAVASAHSYRRSGDRLVGYVALMQMLFAFADIISVAGGQRYDLLWYACRVGLVAGCLIVLFGLLWEYVGLYRREQDKSRELAATAEELREAKVLQEREATLLRLINEAPDAQALVRQAGVLLRDWFDCDAVGIRWRLGDDFPYLESRGFPEDFVEKENALCQRDEAGDIVRDANGLPALECMCGNILRGRTDPALPFFSPGGSFWSNNTTRLLATTTDTDRQARTRNRCNGQGYESVALVPLRFGETIYGLLQLNGKRSDRFSAEGIEFLERMARSLAVRLAQHESESERERLSVEARRRADELETTIRTIPAGVVILDAAGMPVRLNDAAQALFAWTEQEQRLPWGQRMHGRKPRNVGGEPVALEDLPAMRSLHGEVVSGVVFCIDCENEELWLLVNSAPLHSPEGALTGSVATFVDITELQRLTAEAQRLAEDLATTNEELAVTNEELVTVNRELQAAEQEAQRRAAELEAVLSSIGDGVAVYGLDGAIVSVSTSGTRILGVPEETLLQPWEERLRALDLRLPSGEYLPREQAPSTIALRGETVEGRLLRGRRGDGSEVWLSLTGAPVRDTEGAIICAVVSFSDVTPLMEVQRQAQELAEELAATNEELTATNEELSQAEQVARGRAEELEAAQGSLQAAWEELSEAQELAHVGSWYWDAQTDVTTGSDELLRIYGFDPATETMPDFQDQRGRCYPVEDWERVNAAVQATLATGVAYELDVRAIRHGKAIWVSTRGEVVRAADGRIVGLRGTVQDITERKRVQEELERQAALLDLGPVLARDPEDRIVYWGAGMQQLYGYTPQQALGEVVHDFLRTVHPESVAEIRRQIEEAGSWQGQLTHSTATGQRITVLSRQVAFRDDGGKLALILEVNTDMTELRRVQEELQQHRDRLEVLVAQRTAALEANQRRLRNLAAELTTAEQKERQRLATIVHDEVAQTLGAVKLHLGVVRNTYPDAAGDEMGYIAGLLDQATQQARSIMNELNPPVLQRLGLSEALRWWGSLVQERHGIAVHVDAPPQRLPLDNVVEVTLFQAARELIQNSLKHAQASKIEVTVQSADGRLEITVADDGVGFDPAGTETTAEGGFGLFNIHERMAYLAGECLVESTPGQGTRVTLRLPISAAQ